MKTKLYQEYHKQRNAFIAEHCNNINPKKWSIQDQQNASVLFDSAYLSMVSGLFIEHISRINSTAPAEQKVGPEFVEWLGQAYELGLKELAKK